MIEAGVGSDGCNAVTGHINLSALAAKDRIRLLAVADPQLDDVKR
jgi:hypothetical protein